MSQKSKFELKGEKYNLLRNEFLLDKVIFLREKKLTYREIGYILDISYQLAYLLTKNKHSKL